MSKMLNSVVAEKVMGYEWVKNDGSLVAFPEYIWKTDTGYRSSYNPTRDIEDAWKVVDKFDKVKIETFSKGYSVEIFEERMGAFKSLVKEYADTFQMAMSLAALKAKGVEINE